MKQVESYQPQDADSERILKLGNDPVLQGVARNVKVILQIHCSVQFDNLPNLLFDLTV